MQTYREFMRACEREYWLRVLEQSRGNVSEAARTAGVHRSLVHARIARYAIRDARPQRPLVDAAVAAVLRKFLR